jgi:hypothetical protein
MTKFSPELGASICEYLCGHSVVTNICRAHSISTSTYWEWIAKSRRDPPELEPFTWLDMEAPFWMHVQNAKRIFANHMLDTMTERARWGSERRLTYQGKEMFRVRTDIPPDLVDPDVIEMLYDQRDHYLRNADGHLVHLTERIEPPVQLQLAVAAANFAAYQPHSSQSIEVTQRGEMGVKVVGGPRKPDPIKIEHTPILPPAQVLTKPAELASDAPTGEDLPVDAPVDRTPAYVPPEVSSKVPLGTVQVFKAEVPDDPPEIIGDAADNAPADPKPAVRVPPPDIMLHTQVRQAMRKLHDGERGSGAVEMQIMNALRLDLTPEQRERRLHELVGSTHLSQEDRSEGLGAGGPGAGASSIVTTGRPTGPVKMV